MLFSILRKIFVKYIEHLEMFWNYITEHVEGLWQHILAFTNLIINLIMLCHRGHSPYIYRLLTFHGS